MTKPLFTIGYQSTTVRNFLDTLQSAGVKLLVDVRAVAMSRRPGFAKTALAAGLHSVGIDYIHLRRLGTPSDGRVAARAGRHDEMHRIFHAHLATEPAQEALHELAALLGGDRPVALLCFEAEARHCHRAIVAEAVQQLVEVDIVNLMPDVGDVH